MGEPKHQPDSGDPSGAVTFRGGVLRIALRGPHVGHEHGLELGQKAAAYFELAGDGLRQVVIDFSGVEGITSMGIGACLSIRHEAARRRITTHLVGVRREIEEIFRFTKLDAMFRIEGSPPTRGEAPRR